MKTGNGIMKPMTYALSFIFLLSVETVLSVTINIDYEYGNISKIASRKAIKSINSSQIDLEIVTVGESTTVGEMCELIFKKDKKPTLVIDCFRLTYLEQNKYNDSLRLLLRNMGVPTISFTPNLSPWPGPPLTAIERQYLVHIIPPELIMSQIVKSITRFMGTKKTAILFESFTFAEVKNQAGLLFNNIGSRITMEQIDHEEGIDLGLLKTEKEGVTNIFVLASEKIAIETLLQASEYYNPMLRKEYAWFVLTKDETKLVCNKFKSNAKVMLIQPTVVNKDNLNELDSFNLNNKIEFTFYYDFVQHLSNLLHKNVGVEGRWPETLNYPSCGESTTAENNTGREKIKLRDLLEEMQDSGNLKGTFGNFVIKNKDNRKPFGWQDIRMKISMVAYKNGTSKIKDLLEWQYSEVKSPENQFIGRKDSLKNHKGVPLIQITTKHDPPFVYATVKNQKIVFEGLCIDLLEIIMKESKFKYLYKITTTDIFEDGVLKKGGSLNTMISNILDGSADLAIGPIPMMPEWNLKVDFTVSFYDLVGLSILMKRRNLEKDYFRFLIVFDKDLWICILITYFISSFILYFLEQLTLYKFHQQQKKYKDTAKETKFSFMESLWYCIILITPQGGGNDPKKLSSRLISEVWWLFGFIVITSFSANTAAFLTVSRVHYPIENLDDLVNQHKIKYSTVKTSLAYTYFQKMDDIFSLLMETWKNISLDLSFNETESANLAVWDIPVSDRYNKIWLAIKQNPFNDLQHGIFKTLNSDVTEEYAFIGESYEVKYAFLEHCNLLKQVGPEFSKRPIAWAVAKESTLKKTLSEQISKLQYDGRMEELKDKWWNHNPYLNNCYHYNKGNDGIELDNIGGIFYILISGVILALTALSIEFIYFKIKSNVKNIKTVIMFENSSIDPTIFLEKTKVVKCKIKSR